MQSTLKTPSTPPCQNISSTTPSNTQTGVFRKYSPVIMHISEDEITPPPAIYLIPVDENEILE